MPSGHIPKSILVTPRGAPLLVKPGPGVFGYVFLICPLMFGAFVIVACSIAVACLAWPSSAFDAVIVLLFGFLLLCGVVSGMLTSLRDPRVETFAQDQGLVVRETSVLSRRVTVLPADGVMLLVEEEIDNFDGCRSYHLVAKNGRAIRLTQYSCRATAEAACEKLFAALESQRGAGNAKSHASAEEPKKIRGGKMNGPIPSCSGVSSPSPRRAPLLTNSEPIRRELYLWLFFVAFSALAFFSPDSGWTGGSDGAMFGRALSGAFVLCGLVALSIRARVETFLVDGGLVVEETSLLFGRSTLKLPAESVAFRIEEYSDDSGSIHFSLYTDTPYGREIELTRGERAEAEAAREKLLAALESRGKAADSAPKPPADD